MQENVYKALKRQKIKLKEMQLMFAGMGALRRFEQIVFLGKNGKPISEPGISSNIRRDRESNQ